MALKWEEIKCETIEKHFLSNSLEQMRRAKVPGGWFVQQYADGFSTFFYPDPEHLWDGSSLP